LLLNDNQIGYAGAKAAIEAAGGSVEA